MEQAVWLYVGIIAALIGLGFVASIVVSGMETSHQQTVEKSVRKLQQNCNQVCASDIQTMFSVDTTFVRGMKLYSSGKAICTDYAGKTNCSQCDCPVFQKPPENEKASKPFEIDLSTPEAMQLFETHEYKCFMEKFEEGVTIECKG